MNLTPRVYATVGAGLLSLVMAKKRGRWVKVALGAGVGFAAASIIGPQRLPTWRIG